jgi:hypothetical protein
MHIHHRYGAAAKALQCEVAERSELHRILDGSGEVSDQNLACPVSAQSRAATLITMAMARMEHAAVA